MKTYAEIHDRSLTEVLRKNMLARSEDACDMEIFRAYEKEWGAVFGVHRFFCGL